MGEIRIFRAFTGVEVIGEVVEETPSWYKIKNPLHIRVVQSQNDPENIGVAMSPFMPLSETTETCFYRANLLCEPYVPAKEIEQRYRGQFEDSRIIQVPGLILG